MTSWTEQEFASATFNDERLSKRFEQLVAQLGESAGKSIPFACEDWAATKAAYRFFDNPKVSQERIIQSHVDATARRVKKLFSLETEPVLVVQDTTFLNYSRHKKTRGLGEISKFTGSRGESLKASGLILHTALAFSSGGVPLGTLSQKLWTRLKSIGQITKSGKNMTRIPIEENESFRWIEAMREVAIAVPEAARVVHVGDRESDIFEFFSEAEVLDTHFLVRIRDHQRCIEEGGGIFDPVKTMRSKGTYELRVKCSDGRFRVATMEVKYYPVTVLPSAAKTHLPSVPTKHATPCPV